MQDFYTSDPFDAARPRWKSRLYALVLAAALVGLFGCCVRLGWLIATA